MLHTGKLYRAELYQDNKWPYTNVNAIYNTRKDDYPEKKLVVVNGHWCEGAKPCAWYRVDGEWLATTKAWDCLGLTWSNAAPEVKNPSTASGPPPFDKGGDGSVGGGVLDAPRPRWAWSNGVVGDNFICTIPAIVNGQIQTTEYQTTGVKRLCNRTWWGWDKDGNCTVEVTQTAYTLDAIIARMQSLGIVDGIVLDGSGSSQWCDGETWYTGSDGRTVYEFLLLWFDANDGGASGTPPPTEDAGIPSSGSAEPPSPAGKAGESLPLGEGGAAQSAVTDEGKTTRPDTPQTKEANMSNSALVDYIAISPNKYPRTHAIDTITIHHVVGECSVEQLGSIFAPASRRASSNYGVGADGRIGMYVEEKDRAWTSSSTANDDRAVTIEVADEPKYPYKVGDAAYKGLIELCADICRRNGIPKLLWKNDKSLIGQTDKQNMTVHRWFASTACPGDWLMEHMGEIAEEVNKKLDAGVPSSGSAEPPSPPGKAKKDGGARTVYRVMESTAARQIASFADELSAERYRARMTQAGKRVYVAAVKI